MLTHKLQQRRTFVYNTETVLYTSLVTVMVSHVFQIVYSHLNYSNTRVKVRTCDNEW